MRFYLLLLAIALPCAVLYVLYGRAYMWARQPAPALAERGVVLRHHLTRAERMALGMPLRCGALTVAVILSAFAAIALFRPLDPALALGGALALAILLTCAVLFGLLDRFAVRTTVSHVRGVLTHPPADMAYVPRGGLLVGGTPVLYPLHWLPVIEADLGREVDVVLTRHGAVLQHGESLSLDAQVRAHPYRPWQPTAVIAAALVALTVASLFFYAPLGDRLQQAREALSTHRLVVIDGDDAWRAWQPRVGDEIVVDGLTGDCAWVADPVLPGVGQHHCDDVAIGVAPAAGAGAGNGLQGTTLQSLSPQDVTPQIQAAFELSQSMELMLTSRRNARPEEVRAYWRQAGQGSSQRWTLAGLAQVQRLTDQLCGQAACEMREEIAQARASIANQVADPVADAVTVDAQTVNRLSRAGFALAAATLDPLMRDAVQAMSERHAAAQWRVRSATGAVLGQAPDARPATQAIAHAYQAAGPASPRLRGLQLQQVLQAAGTHPIAFSGRVTQVDSAATAMQLVVDPRIRPSAAWVKVAPVAGWMVLLLVALAAVVLMLRQRRVAARHLAEIERKMGVNLSKNE